MPKKVSLPMSFEERLQAATKGTPPKWWKPDLLPTLTIKDSPFDGALHDVIALLARSDAPSSVALLEEIAARLDVAQRSAWIFAVFTQWEEKKRPAKDEWIERLLREWSDHSIPSRLRTLVEDWLDHKKYQRAYRIVRLLAELPFEESISALETLSHIHPSPALKREALSALQDRAAREHTTCAELFERAPIDVGLSSTGELELDYGPRRFLARLARDFSLELFDERARPIKSLPKPGKNDDETKASAAGVRLKDAKANVRVGKSLVVRRLELALVEQRRWPIPLWKSRFLDHPLYRLITPTILWGSFNESEKPTPFRVAEDGTFANQEDDEWIAPDNAMIGVVHPLDLSNEQRDAWLAVWKDYRLEPFFEQLHRAVFVPTAAEADAMVSERFADRAVDSRVFAPMMTKAGWIDVTTIQESAHRRLFESAGVCAVLYHTPPYSSSEVTLLTLAFAESQGRLIGAPRAIRDVPPLVFSEAVRDIERLAR